AGRVGGGGGVEQGQEDQETPRRDLAGDEQADTARCDQDDLHGIAVLPKECTPLGLDLARGQLVRSVASQSGSGFSVGQAERWFDALRLERLLRAERVPGWLPASDPPPSGRSA